MRRPLSRLLAFLAVALSAAAADATKVEGKCLLGVLGQPADAQRALALWRSLGGEPDAVAQPGGGSLRRYGAAGVEARIDANGPVRSLRFMLEALRGSALRRFRGRPPFALEPQKLREAVRAAAAKKGGMTDRFRFHGVDVSTRLTGTPPRFREMTVALRGDVPPAGL